MINSYLRHKEASFHCTKHKHESQQAARHSGQNQPDTNTTLGMALLAVCEHIKVQFVSELLDSKLITSQTLLCGS